MYNRKLSKIQDFGSNQFSTQKGKYAQIKRQNRYDENGGWVRIRQENGTFRYEWNDEVSDQQSVDEKHSEQDATFVGKGGKVAGTSDKNYALMKDGKVRELKEGGIVGDFVNASEIIGKSNLPTFSEGTYDGPTDVNPDPKKEEIENINVKARFNINNLTAKERNELKIIQFVYSDNEPHLDGLGEIDGKLAFVDGGKNSAKHRPQPWYGYQKSLKGYNYDKKGTSSGMSFKLSDQPGAITQQAETRILNGGDRRGVFDLGMAHYKELNFESYVVIPDYNGSGEFRIISVIHWGFKNENWKITKTIENPIMVATANFSEKAQTIWDNDYGKSAYKQY